MPALASRTAASSAPLRVTRVRSANDGSAQIGPEFRYRAGTGSPSAYQPAPKPSMFIVPLPRIIRGAQACRYRPSGGSMIASRSVTGGPR